MNNYQKIKAISIDEMAKFISAVDYCGFQDCFIKGKGMKKLCTLTSSYSSGIKQWLESEEE